MHRLFFAALSLAVAFLLTGWHCWRVALSWVGAGAKIAGLNRRSEMSRFSLAVLALLALALALATAAGKSGKAHADGPGYVSGIVYHDKDMDGERDESDPPIAWYRVKLTEPNNPDARPRTTISGSDGRYRFDGLERGVDYEVTLQSDDRTLCATMPGSGGWGLGESDEPFFDDIDFGVVRKGSGRISGTVVDDLNENGIRDPGEPPMEGWSVTLGNITDDQSMYCGLESTSNADGSFTFDDLPLFAYSLAVWPTGVTSDDARQPWEVTYVSPSESPATFDMLLTYPKITLTGRQYARRVQVGVHFLSGSAAIAGMVFEDRDLDGMHDDGEPGIGSPPPIWLWRLFDGQLLGVENFPYPMQPSGRFEIAGLPAGTYYVAIADPYFSGTMPTAANGFPYRWVTVAEGQHAEGVDFGYAPQPIEPLPSQTPAPVTPAAESTPAMHAPDVGTGNTQGGGGMLPVILLLAAGVAALGSGFALIRHSRR